MNKQRTLAPILALLMVGLSTTGCTELLEAAGTLTFGDPDIPVVELNQEWPSVGDMAGLDSATLSAVPGMPTDLSKGTFAHLQGALRVTGECYITANVDELAETAGADSGLSDSGVKVEFEITSCTADDSRCADRCYVEDQDEPFRGMIFSTSVTAEILNEETAGLLEEQREQSPVSGEGAASAVEQIRMQFYKLRLYQKVGKDDDGNDIEKVLNEHIEGVQLLLADEDGSNEVEILNETALDTISEATPQRYDVASDSVFTTNLKNQILKAQPTSITIRQRMRIPQASLYEVSLEGGAVEIKVQPEIVISAVSGAKSLVAEKAGGAE